MRKIIIDILLVFSAIYLIRAVFLGIKTGKVEVRYGIVYKKKKKPFVYWMVLGVQSLIAIALLFLIFVIHSTQ